MAASALQPVQAAVFALLHADNTLHTTLGTEVYDEFPQGTTPTYPYIEMGEFIESLSNVFGKKGRRVEATIRGWDDQPGYKRLQAVLDRLNALLDDQLLPNPTGWVTQQTEYLQGRLQRDPDLPLRMLIVTYAIEVQEP